MTSWPRWAITAALRGRGIEAVGRGVRRHVHGYAGALSLSDTCDAIVVRQPAVCEQPVRGLAPNRRAKCARRGEARGGSVGEDGGALPVTSVAPFGHCCESFYGAPPRVCEEGRASQ
jgi:hypothetical protein